MSFMGKGEENIQDKSTLIFNTHLKNKTRATELTQ